MGLRLHPARSGRTQRHTGPNTGWSCALSILCRDELNTQLFSFHFGLLLCGGEVCFCELPVVVRLCNFMHRDEGVEQVAVFLMPRLVMISVFSVMMSPRSSSRRTCLATVLRAMCSFLAMVAVLGWHWLVLRSA